MSFDTIIDFIEPINMYELSNDEGFKENQLGNHVVVFESFIPDLTNIDIVIIGCNEIRGAGTDNLPLNSVNFIRSQFYSLYHWHKDVHLADLGNIKIGTTIQDTYAALKTVVRELINNNNAKR
ncbi:MAG TPA: hypothetical protein PKZ66_08330 [Chitinophagaceae bacterium]|nr:hypothetical protein [Chitinophagaceae bacterium]